MQRGVWWCKSCRSGGVKSIGNGNRLLHCEGRLSTRFGSVFIRKLLNCGVGVKRDERSSKRFMAGRVNCDA